MGTKWAPEYNTTDRAFDPLVAFSATVALQIAFYVHKSSSMK